MTGSDSVVGLEMVVVVVDISFLSCPVTDPFLLGLLGWSYLMSFGSERWELGCRVNRKDLGANMVTFMEPWSRAV
jgi:hypothetical protein